MKLLSRGLFPLAIAALLLLEDRPPAAANPADECSGSSQVEIGNCVAETEKIVDGVVEMYLGFAMQAAAETDSYTSGTKLSVDALKASQTAWETFRDRQCEFVGTTYGGGSGTYIAISACRVELGRERVRQLERFIR